MRLLLKNKQVVEHQKITANHKKARHLKLILVFSLYEKTQETGSLKSSL